MKQYDFKINYEYNGVSHPLPYAFFDKELKFNWENPMGISQKSYIFEMRTVNPVLYSDGHTYMCAYYSSARVYSSKTCHYISTINGTSIDIDNWAGICEVRLRVFDEQGQEYCTHDIVVDGKTYDFQKDVPQYRCWDSRNDGFYFCFDAINDDALNLQKVKFQFKQSIDVDESQNLKYILQISDSPLFGLGLYSKSLIEKDNIQINTTYANISATFQWEKDPDKWEEQSLSSLKPNTLYFCRVRAFDGYDYSEWSRVNAVRMIRNTIPQPKILGVYYPIGSVQNKGVIFSELMHVNQFNSSLTLKQNNRQNGEIIIKIKIDDDDNDYVIGNLSFSMFVNQVQAKNLGIVSNESNYPLNYFDYHEKEKLIRIRTKENLLKIPTNQEIDIVWYTSNEIKNQKKDSVYIYLAAYDDMNAAYDDMNQVVQTSEKLIINNLQIGQSGESTLSQLRWWCKGEFSRNQAYPVLPDTMLRQGLSIKNGIIENNQKEDEDEIKTGSIGYTENNNNAGVNWYDYWYKYENGDINIGNDKDDDNNKSPKSYGTQRITQKDMVVNYYNKYLIFKQKDQQGNVIDEYPIPSLASSSSVEAEGFIMFCLKCNELQIMQNKILLQNNKVFDSLEEAFPEDSFDGTPYKLIFVCPKCKSVMNMNSKYQSNLAYGTCSMIKKEEYSYYHGYNSDSNYLNDNGLSKQLLATRQKQYDALVEDWKDKQGEDSEYPYEFQLFSQWYDEDQQQFDNIYKQQGSNLMSSEKFGFLPKGKLLNLSQRPEFESVISVHPPKINNYKYAPYVDGTRLNETIESDYMYGYEPSPGGTSIEGDYIPPDPGDPDLERLSKQFPWNLRNRMNYEFVQGKKTIEYDEKTSYLGAESDGNNNEKQEQKQEEKQEKEVKTYQIIHVRYDAENPCVNHTYNSTYNISTIYNRASFFIKMKFPLLIQKNINDRYLIRLNDKQIFSGSILSDNQELQNCLYPYTNNISNGYMTNLFGVQKGYLTKIFHNICSVPSTSQYENYDDQYANNNTQQMFFNIYGKMKENIKKIQILNCENSCYDLFNLAPSVVFQNSSVFPGTVNYSRYECPNPYVFMGSEKSGGNEGNQDTPSDEQHRYYYTVLEQNEHKYDWEENPVDNTIEDDFGVLSKVSKGQPLFTCYKDQVNKEGFHFKFTEEDFQKTGKIFVRRYHIQSCNSFPKPGFGANGEPGFRNWIVVPIQGKSDRYYRKKVLNMRGNPAYPKMIDVKTEQGIIQQWGFFESNLPEAKCISHKEQEKDDSSSENMDKPPVYLRQEKDTWKNKMYPKTCVVFDYVDITEAITKNIVDMQQKINPFNHKTPINFNSGIFDEMLNRYGTYVMGGYDLTNEQKKLQNNGLSYEKVFSSTVMVLENGSTTSSSVQYTDLVPNNWRPLLINSIFDVDEKEKENYTVLVKKEEKKNNNSSSSEDDKVFENKSVDSYDKYKKIWLNKVKINEDMESMQMSQLTVQQFNPGIKAKFGVYEKWGYQPEKRVDEYFKIDEENLYGTQYIPLTSKIVHSIFDDPFTNLRIKSRLITERKMISDKSFMKIDDNYDKLPMLNYRLIGDINGIAMQYFSGYPKNEHPAYKNRPEPVYPYDRQWRIGGFNRTRYANLNEQGYFNSNYSNITPQFQLGVNDYNNMTEIGFQYPYGAYIDNLLSYDSNARFYYLQDEWNTYNRIHWEVLRDKNQWSCLYAQEVESIESANPIGERISLKTISSKWSSELGAWYIPYNEQMTDMIDTLNAGLKNGKCYQFLMQMVNKNSLERGQLIVSKVFKISHSAVSPVTITETDYNIWTKELTIYCRFDDSLGRKYDIVAAKYSVYDETINGVRYNDWKDLNVSLLKGEIYNLSSNLYGDNVAHNNLIIKHKIILNIEDLNITATDSLRVQLFSSLSLNRQGLTMPVFNVKLWANEFLKPVEERLRFLQGYKNRWIYEDTLQYDEETHQTTINSQWKYVDEQEAVVVPGSIQVTESKLIEIENTFNKQYYGIALFNYPDLDAVQHWINDLNLWNDFYYVNIFSNFLQSNINYQKKYNEFKENYKDSQSRLFFINKQFLLQNQLNGIFNEYFQNNKYNYLLSFKNNNNKSFLQWYSNSIDHNVVLDYSVYRKKFIENYLEEYYEINGNSSSSDSSSSDSSSSQIEISDKSIIDFIIQTNKQNNFIEFYTSSIMYVDTRFEERAWIMFHKYGVETPNLWQSSIDASPSKLYDNQLNKNESLYDNWLSKNESLYDNLSDKYLMFLVEQKQQHVNNVGKSLYRMNFLQSSAGNSQTYSQKYQAIHRTLNELYEQLNEKMILKNKLDTDHRTHLIKQGYFCNGFENNKPYREDGSINTCFRWRVETRNYEGSIDSNTVYDEDGNSEYGYQPRFDMYIRFQMDFFNTFDSQIGKPLRDILFLGEEKDENRIEARINNADNQIKTYPNSISNEEKVADIPLIQETLVNPNKEEDEEVKKKDINALQFSAQINLPKEYLPGQMQTDILPSIYKNGWQNSLEKDYYPNEDDYKTAYYWRIAPYNLVDRPVFESMMGEVKIINTSKSQRQIIFNNIYHNSDIKYSDYTTKLYIAYNKLIYPWINIDSENASYLENEIDTYPYWNNSINSKNLNIQPYNNDWINKEMIKRGQVQFITDRPRKMSLFDDEQIIITSSSTSEYVEYHADSYEIKINNEPEYTYNKMKDTYTIVDNELIPIYIRKYNTIELYLFYAVFNNKKHWFISRNLPGYQPLSTQVTESGEILFNLSNFTIQGFKGNANELKIYEGKQTKMDYWLFHSESENIYPCMTSMTLWTSYGSYRPSEKVDITAIIMESSSSIENNFGDNHFKNAEVEFISDNLNNYDSIWYPYSPIRKKPFVLRLQTEYLMFSYKLKSSYYIAKEEQTCQQNVITLSRGFVNNLFGEESVCFPKYNYESLNEIIPNAYSYENPCVVDLQNGIYRMYFNVKLYDEDNGFTTEIYKADTIDFDKWYDYERINMIKNNSLSSSNSESINHVSGCLEPFVSIKIFDNDSYSSDIENKYTYKYEMYVSSKQENQGFFTIKHYISQDGINFNFNERIHNDGTDGWYNCCSPCVYEDDNIKKLYFTMVSSQSASSTDTSEIIVSLDWINETNNWRQYEINGQSRLIVEKGSPLLINKPFTGAFSSPNQQIHFSNPCVIYDLDNGHPVQRIYYNTYDTPYIWYEGNLTLASGLQELTIHSEYLEEYNWKLEEYVNNNDQSIQIFSSKDNINWTTIKKGGYEYDVKYLLPSNEYIKYIWKSAMENNNMYGVKILIQPANTIITNLSQGAWIGFDNHMNTSATLLPETYDDYFYDLDNYTVKDFIQQYDDLRVKYYQWQNNNPEKNELQFIIENQYYSQYVWWSLQGPCIYRYIGWDVIQHYNWSIKNEQ